MAEIETPDPGLAEVRFVRIFREHYPSVRAYVGRRAKSELVDDIVAETFLVAWRRLEDVPADARPWLLGVARKVLATQLRSLKRRESLRDRLLSATPPAAEEEHGRATPATEALARLREKDREAITLVAWDGLTPKQAAAVLRPVVGAGRGLAAAPAQKGRARASLGRSPLHPSTEFALQAHETPASQSER